MTFSFFEKIGLNILRRRVLGMTGWKTKLGCAVVILSSLAMTIQAFLDGDWTKIQLGLAGIGTGLAGIGIGHKIEKQERKQLKQTIPNKRNEGGDENAKRYR